MLNIATSYSMTEVQLLVLIIVHEVAQLVCVCPMHCHQIACTTGVLSCAEGGLQQIPAFLPPGTSKILLTNHRFTTPHLQYSNLTDYGPPQFKVIKITIQNCGLTGISSNTFSHLTDLSILDLAHNRLSEVVPDTFASLTLKFLRLDGNRDIILHVHSFRGLILSTLSLIDCALTHLAFETINEVSGSLKSLFLINNKIKVFDRQFKHIFEQLTVLQINDNPINCTCDLQWLRTVLLWRRKQYGVVDGSGGVSTEATCHSPASVAHKPMTSVTARDFNCHVPQLRLLDIVMTSPASARLTCSAEPESADPPAVRWLTRSSHGLVQETQAPQAAALAVHSRFAVDQFLCVISNLNGNVTVLVKIQWPDASTDYSAASVPQLRLITLRPSINHTESSNHLYLKRFTLLEMIGAVVGTFTFTMVLFLGIYRYLVFSLGRHRKKKWYVSYEATGRSEGETYDVPRCGRVPHYSGQMFANHDGPTGVGHVNGTGTIPRVSMPVAL